MTIPGFKGGTVRISIEYPFERRELHKIAQVPARAGEAAGLRRRTRIHSIRLYRGRLLPITPERARLIPSTRTVRTGQARATALRSGRMRLFNSIGFIGLVVFCAVVLTVFVLSAPASVAPDLNEFPSKWPWLMPDMPPVPPAGQPVRLKGATAIR